ncbi:hypothetical protein [Shimia sp.]|uniref:hypothetical protein n=1 Tax=Shimia sp. TaxID=1954381 RepID=UPI003B8CFE9A
MTEQNSQQAKQGNLFTRDFEPLRDPRGRKSFKPSDENRLLVMTLAAQNWTHDNIAAFMGQKSEGGTFDPKTLRKYFSRELEMGRLMIEGMAHQVVVDKMMTGNLTAAKKLLEDLTAFVPKKPPEKKPEAEKPIGKKQALERDAKNPTGGWGAILGGSEAIN